MLNLPKHPRIEDFDYKGMILRMELGRGLCVRREFVDFMLDEWKFAIFYHADRLEEMDMSPN